jgi:uncharacterized membrane protein YeaQ/YmgE (transglycosylase-associated protein family)
MINVILWLVFGVLVGWLAGIVMNDHEGSLPNILVGVVGALIGGLLFGGPTITADIFNESGAFNLPSVLVSLVGAVMLVAIVKLVRRASVRFQ